MRDLHILTLVLLTLVLSVSVNFIVTGQSTNSNWNSFGSSVNYIDSSNTVSVTIFDNDSGMAIPQAYSLNELEFKTNSLNLINEIRALCDTLSYIRHREMYVIVFSTYNNRNFIVIQDWAFQLIKPENQDIRGALNQNDKIFYIIAGDTSQVTETLIDSVFVKQSDSINIRFQLEVIPNYLLFMDDLVTRVECEIDGDSLHTMKYIKDGKLVFDLWNK